MLQQPQYSTIDQYGTPTCIQVQSIQHYDVSTQYGTPPFIQVRYIQHYDTSTRYARFGMVGHVRMQKNMVIGISSNGGMKTIDGRWLLQKNQWERIMMVVSKPLHPCGPVSRTTTSSFAIYTVVVSRCR
jgi:hypothetical protein